METLYMPGTLLHTGNIWVNKWDKNSFQLQDSVLAASKRILTTQLYIGYIYVQKGKKPTTKPASLAEAHQHSNTLL